MSDVYKQIHIEPSDIWKTVFSTVYGTFFSHSMQHGDCNVPATFQSLMTIIFWDFIGKFVHVYLDNIFVFSDSIEDHEKHLGEHLINCAKRNYILRRANLISTQSEWIALVILLMTEVYMRTQTRWPASMNGAHLGTSTTCRGSLGWSNIWLIFCQM